MTNMRINKYAHIIFILVFNLNIYNSYHIDSFQIFLSSHKQKLTCSQIYKFALVNINKN